MKWKKKCVSFSVRPFGNLKIDLDFILKQKAQFNLKSHIIPKELGMESIKYILKRLKNSLNVKLYEFMNNGFFKDELVKNARGNLKEIFFRAKRN